MLIYTHINSLDIDFTVRTILKLYFIPECEYLFL